MNPNLILQQKVTNLHKRQYINISLKMKNLKNFYFILNNFF